MPYLPQTSWEAPLRHPGYPAATAVEAGLEAAIRRIGEESAAGPERAELAGAPFLTDWSFGVDRLLGGAVLKGRVYGHPGIEEGACIATSHLVAIDGAAAEWARTVSRYYRLGRKESETAH